MILLCHFLPHFINQNNLKEKKNEKGKKWFFVVTNDWLTAVKDWLTAYLKSTDSEKYIFMRPKKSGKKSAVFFF